MYFRLCKISLMLLGLSLFCHAAGAAVKIDHWQTSTGSQVYFVENHDLPFMDLSVNFPAGSARDTQQTSGLASLTHYLMTLGAAGLTDEQISNQLADIGADLGGDLDADRASLSLRTLTANQDKALAIFNKVLQQPDFPTEILTREKTRIVAGLQESATQPESIVSKAFMHALYANHPYGLAESGEIDTVTALKRADLQAFYQQYYTAKSAVVSMIGDLTEAQAREIAEKIATGLPQTPAVADLPEATYPTVASLQNIPHPATQAHILLGYPGAKRGDTDYFPLYVGNYILGGGGFVSRLTEEVREKRGLVYSVYSYFMPMQQLGPFLIGLQTKKDQAQDALKLVNETTAKFLKEGVTEKELQGAKANITGGFPMRIDTNAKIINYLNVIGFYKLPLTYLDDFNKEVNKVTAQQIKEAFSRRIDPDHFVTVLVGAQSPP